MSIDESVEGLLEEISSQSPAPGGGGVAALSGCFGAALISMVCKLSIGRKNYEDFEDELKRVQNEAEALRKELLELFKEDVDAFNEVMAALKRAKATREEKRIELLQYAYKRAANVPFEVVKKCFGVMELAEITTSKGNQNAITDSGVGALMAYSGLKGAVMNVKVNLRYIKDRNFIADKEYGIEEIENRAEEVLEAITRRVERSVSRDQNPSSS